MRYKIFPFKRGVSLSLFVIILFLIFVWENRTVRADKDDGEAGKAAQNWLMMGDKGRYSDSRETAADVFKSGVSEKQWQKTMKTMRKPLGKVVTRKLRSKQYKTGLPGLSCMDCGEYVIMEYDSDFENKISVRETITLLRDGNGKWSVADYYIR